MKKTQFGLGLLCGLVVMAIAAGGIIRRNPVPCEWVGIDGTNAIRITAQGVLQTRVGTNVYSGFNSSTGAVNFVNGIAVP
jgi:hypothetical protein